MASYFESVHRQNEALGHKTHDLEVNTVVASFLEKSPLEYPECTESTFQEVKKIIKKLKNKKSFGPDNIPSIVLKKLPDNGIALITTISNGILRLSYFPTKWKCAHVIPMHKPNKPANEVESMRPISLLSNLSKVFEKILYARISTFAEMKNIIPNFQFGFRKGHSTLHALMNLHEKVATGFNVDKTLIALFLDIEKAFDTVWIKGLIFKLIKLNFPPYLMTT